MAAGAATIAVLLAGLPVELSEKAAASGSRRCHLLTVTIRGTHKDDVLQGTPGDDVISGFGGNDRLIGGGGSDYLCGGRGDDTLDGGEGIDWLLPGGGRDIATGGADSINVISYLPSPAAIGINLRTGIARGWGRDSVRNVHQVEGTQFDDVVVGDSSGNALVGLGGRDRLRGGRGEDSLVGGSGDDDLSGGRGSDYAVFIDSGSAVRVDLARGTARGEGADRLRAFENVFGSREDDVLTGTKRSNVFIGGVAGDDDIVGRGGSDVVFRYYGAGSVDGGRGRDKVFYAFPGAIDLTSGTAVGIDFSDSLLRVENVVGGGGRHTIIGDDARNELAGGGGLDVIRGSGGDDTISGDGGDDLLAGGEGSDELRGGGGEDSCVEGESLSSCERTSITDKSDALSLGDWPASWWLPRWACGPTVPNLVSQPALDLRCRVASFQEEHAS